MSANLRRRSSGSVPLLKAGLIWPRLDHVPAVPVPMPAHSGSSVWPTWRGRLARPCRQPSPSKRLISRSQAWAAVPCTADAHPTTTRMSRSATVWIGRAARGQLTGNSAWVDAPQALVNSTTINTNHDRTRRMTDSAADRSAARPRAASLAAGSPFMRGPAPDLTATLRLLADAGGCP